MKKILIIFLIITFIPVNIAFAFKPNDDFFADQKYLADINIEPAWGKATGKGVIVAVLDSGVDVDHPDLAGNLVDGYDFVNDTTDPRPKIDDNYSLEGVNHGTVVAGIIAAKTNNGLGVAGIAHEAKIMPLKVLNSAGTGDVSALIKAIYFAVEHGANIVNLSLVGYEYNQPLAEAINWAYTHNVLVVAAAGNDNINLDNKPAYPACVSDNQSHNLVLASIAVDNNNIKLTSSNFGKKCISLAAPGVIDIGLANGGKNEDGSYADFYSGGWQGTSFASAVVSGVAALIKSINPSLTPDQIREVLMRNTTNIDLINANYQGMVGTGLIDAAKAVSDPSLNAGKIYSSGKKRIYIASDGKKYDLSDKTIFASWFNNSNLNIYATSSPEVMKNSQSVLPRSGYLVKFDNSQKIYGQYEGMALCELTTVQLKNNFGKNYKQNILTLPAQFAKNYSLEKKCQNNFYNYPQGSLIKYSDSPDVWYIDGQQKRLVTEKGFLLNQFNKKQIISNANKDIYYFTGPSIDSWEEKIFPFIY